MHHICSLQGEVWLSMTAHLRVSIFSCYPLYLVCSMWERAYDDKCRWFRPINIMMQQSGHPCLYMSVFSSLVLSFSESSPFLKVD